jgi:hypothetical protein
VVTAVDGDELLWYDLRRATLGDVTVTMPDDADGPALRHLFLLETRYDGFRFGELPGGVDDESALLHVVEGKRSADLVDDGGQPERRPTGVGRVLYRTTGLLKNPPLLGDRRILDAEGIPSERLVQTYLDAKNGARQVGADDVAGQFFKREKRYRRRGYWEHVCGLTDRPTPIWRSAWDWVKSLSLDLTAAYGESPARVISFSGVTILGFALLFAVLLDRPPYGNQYLASELLPEWLATAIQPLTLSIESFVTLVLVGPADQRITPLVHLLAQVEGFLGVFLVALFVFTLTRSIRR